MNIFFLDEDLNVVYDELYNETNNHFDKYKYWDTRRRQVFDKSGIYYAMADCCEDCSIHGGSGWNDMAVPPRSNIVQFVVPGDIDGDGKVEVAVGGNWNPGNTDSEEQSGSIHYLGSLGKVKPVQLPHDPTTHRMRWVHVGDKKYALVVLPLHGRGNRGGEGKPVNVTAYFPPSNPSAGGSWKTAIINNEPCPQKKKSQLQVLV